jgi:hypothetical protein
MLGGQLGDRSPAVVDLGPPPFAVSDLATLAAT